MEIRERGERREEARVRENEMNAEQSHNYVLFSLRGTNETTVTTTWST